MGAERNPRSVLEGNGAVGRRHLRAPLAYRPAPTTVSLRLWCFNQRRRLCGRAHGESDPHPRQSMTGYAAEDQVVTRRRGGEPQDVRAELSDAFARLLAVGTGNGGPVGRHVRYGAAAVDDLGAMRCPVIIHEIHDHRAAERNDQGQLAIGVAVEVERALGPAGNPGDQLELGGPGGGVPLEPARVRARCRGKSW